MVCLQRKRSQTSDPCIPTKKELLLSRRWRTELSNPFFQVWDVLFLEKMILRPPKIEIVGTRSTYALVPIFDPMGLTDL